MGGKNSTQQGQNVSEKKTLDIAVTGVSGSGKSSFINALRGLSDFEEGAAKTGVAQTTMEPTCYPHPTFPNVTIWDLPGIGIFPFREQEYTEQVNLSRYDFFIIVGSDRFNTCDIHLCRAVQKMGKRFYYIRNKVDVNILLEKRKPNFSEERVLQCIQEYTIKMLVEIGVSAEVFLISRWDFHKYDFPRLQRTLDHEINELRSHILRPGVLQDSEKGRHDSCDNNKKNVAVRSPPTLATPSVGLSKPETNRCMIFFSSAESPGRAITGDDNSESKEGRESFPESVAATHRGLNVLEKHTLDFAITGAAGAGKSSLVNALRGLSDFAEGAAQTDVIEGTTEPMGYPHPTFPDVTIWDLPGIGTPRFKAEEYLERVNFNQYDFFIIVASDRFTVYDLQLSHAIQIMGKRFYYVRSKMDVSIKNEKIKPDFNEQATLRKVRKYCLDHLVKAGISSPEIFLISSWYDDKYDFPLLKRTLENEISEEGRGRSTALSQNSGILSFLSKAALTFDLAKLKNTLAQKCFKQVTADIRQELAALENVNLNIAITGVAGAGKSSFVNALRGMTDYEEGAAKTGIMQTTMEPHSYAHPSFPKVTLCDLPGIGTPEFNPQDYLEKINFKKYDFFIIVSSDRFTESDAMLAREIQKRKKRFYYVRSKMDISIASEILDPNFNMENTIKKLRKYCCDNLIKSGDLSPKVFHISRRDLNMYDFPILQEALENDLDDLKRHAFVASLPVFSREILKKKKAAMEDLIWKVALTSGNSGMFPVLGLPLVCDVYILVATLKLFYKVFGLDEDSLRRVANVVGQEYHVLKSAVKKSPMSSEITPDFVIQLLGKSQLQVTLMELVLHLIPLLGLLIGGASSFMATYCMLKCFLRNIVEDAENVRAKAAEP